MGCKKSSTWLLSPIALEVLQELAESHFTAEYIFVSAIGEMILQYNFLQFLYLQGERNDYVHVAMKEEPTITYTDEKWGFFVTKGL